MYLADIPYDLKFNVMLHSNFDNIRLLCSTNRAFHDICNDPYFWQQKINLDFGFIIPDISVDYHVYKLLHNKLKRKAVLTPYMLYVMYNLNRIHSENSNQLQIHSISSNEWKMLTDTQKQQYIDAAKIYNNKFYTIRKK